jgi:hypothetical protein
MHCSPGTALSLIMAAGHEDIPLAAASSPLKGHAVGAAADGQGAAGERLPKAGSFSSDTEALRPAADQGVTVARLLSWLISEAAERREKARLGHRGKERDDDLLKEWSSKLPTLRTIQGSAPAACILPALITPCHPVFPSGCRAVLHLLCLQPCMQ